MGKRFRDFSLPSVVINEEMEILDASDLFIEKFGWHRSFLSIADSGSHAKIVNHLPTIKRAEPLEVSLQRKDSQLDFVDLYATWSNGEGIITIAQKSSQYTLVSTKLGQIQAELSIRNQELSDEKDNAEAILNELYIRSAPPIVIQDGITLIPIYGGIDSSYMDQIFSRLLNHFLNEQTETAILDFTASTDFSFSSWNGVDQFVKSASIMGVKTVVTGLHPKQVKTLQDMTIQSNGTRFYAKLSNALSDLTKKA